MSQKYLKSLSRHRRVTVALFQATICALYGTQLLTCHRGNQENGAKQVITEKGVRRRSSPSEN